MRHELIINEGTGAVQKRGMDAYIVGFLKEFFQRHVAYAILCSIFVILNGIEGKHLHVEALRYDAGDFPATAPRPTMPYVFP
jgi:hypothetical protein